MKKATIFILSVLLLALGAEAGHWTSLNSSGEPFTVQVLETDGERTLLKYTVNGYFKDEVAIDGRNYTLFKKLPKESMIEKKGFPRLPRINRAIIIPDEGVMDFEVISAEFIEIENIEVAPSKGHFSRNIDPATVPYTFSSVYDEDALFPADLVNLREPYILRDYRGLVVELNAFQYNPVTKILRICTRATIEVKKTRAGGANVLVRSKPLRKVDPQFHKIYKRRFINYNQLDYPILLESGELLIICYDDFMGELDSLVVWKNQRGIPTTIVPVSEAGSNPDEIKNYVRQFYNTNDLGYLLIVGDHPQIPTFSSGSDPVYGLLSGSDSYPEIFVGRFSAETRDQVETQVERTITYEKYPDPAGDWYHMGLGDADESGPCNPEQYDFQHITNIALDLLRWNYTQVDSVYTTFGGTTQMISDFLNEGRSIFNYAGHGWTTGMGPVNFNNNNVNALVNDNRLTHLVAIACEPGNFVSTTCFGEAWLRATNNVTGAPTGAIATYLSKVSQSWFPPYDMQDEGVDLLCADSMLTFGGMCFNGSGLMIDLHGSMGEWEFKNWTIFGDPSVYLRSATPYGLTVTHNPTIPVGSSSFDVVVSGPGGPMEGAMVCGMNEEIYATGLTDAFGFVTLNFDPPPVIPGVFTLTITTANAIPYIEDVDIITLSGPYVIYSDHTVQDDLTGNNNGQLDYAETVELSITVENLGIENATNVSGTLATDDTLVTITQNAAFFGDIPVNSTVTVDRAFEFEIATEVTDGHPVVFHLTTSDGVNTWESSFSVIAHAPDVVFTSLIIDDTAGGNGNGNLDPGESADLQVTLMNNGSTDVESVEALLSCNDPYVTVNSAMAAYGALQVGEEATGSFGISVSPSCPQEHTVNFDLVVTGALGYANVTGFSTVVGDILYLPSGPDNYGYMAYDRFDAPLMPVFDWVELHPDSGGSGTNVPFTEDEQVFHYVLPFTFQYYGLEYDSLTIAANGWLGMGTIGPDDYSNSGIPNSDGPAPMIASYWEDLSPQRTNSGGVWFWYDATNHRYVVEYNHVEQYSPTGNFETFETILYDPQYYGTATGDGQILVQYKQMSNASQTEGTIGIENHDETDGIQFFFDGSYDPHAAPIEDGTAILYTTPLTVPEVSVTLTPATLPIIIPASGGSFDYNIEVANNGASSAMFDLWCDATLPGGAVFGPLLGPVDLNLPSGFVGDRDRTQTVPGRAPAGDYTYNAYIGVYPNTVWDEDQFTFEKLEVGDGALVGGWSNYGESFEEWLTTGVAAELPASYSLNQNYPNPFNPTTTISFQLPVACKVKLDVFDVSGRLIESPLRGGWRDAGMHEVMFDGSNLASGIYIYRLTAGDFSATGKMVLMK